ncbi:MAG: hypothetical protein AAGB34_00630 [Planctomycetota bacterium]
MRRKYGQPTGPDDRQTDWPLLVGLAVSIVAHLAVGVAIAYTPPRDEAALAPGEVPQAQRPPLLKQDRPIKLGDDQSNRITMSWLASDDFAELTSPKPSEVDQAMLDPDGAPETVDAERQQPTPPPTLAQQPPSGEPIMLAGPPEPTTASAPNGESDRTVEGIPFQLPESLNGILALAEIQPSDLPPSPFPSPTKDRQEKPVVSGNETPEPQPIPERVAQAKTEQPSETEPAEEVEPQPVLKPIAEAAPSRRQYAMPRSSQSILAALKEAPRIRSGSPVTSRGVRVTTTHIHHDHTTRLTAGRRDAFVRIFFQADGTVANVGFIASTGDQYADFDIEKAIYKWTAEGEVLENLVETRGPDATHWVDLRIIR